MSAENVGTVRPVLLLGKGSLAVRIAEWFLESPRFELRQVVPVVPEPEWTDSLTDWARARGVRVVDSGDYREVALEAYPGGRIPLVFSVFYDRILSAEFLSACDRALNLHNAPLPAYRGVSPINWALKNEETSHGVTIHEMSPGVDDGPIVAQIRYSIYPEFDEVVDVYARALEYGWVLFEQTMPILDRIEARPQPDDGASHHRAADRGRLGDRAGFTRSPAPAESPAAAGPVPLFDAVAEHAEIGPAVEAAIRRVVRSGRFVGGPEVAAFESEFATAVEGRAVAAVGSGTDALRLALAALGIGPGDEVVIPANTFTATAMAVESLGAVPVVADVDPDLWVVTAELVEPLLTSATRAIVPVHLYGQMAPMPDLLELAAGRDVAVVEDAAQAHGASAHGRPAGAWGRAAAFSFYPSKNLGAYGDGGAVVGDDGVVERVRVLRDLGRNPEGAHVEIAVNSRLDAVQAAVLRTKLPHLRRWIDRRRAVAARYREALSDVPVGLPAEASWGVHAYHLFVVRVGAGRDEVRRALAEGGVEAGVHYPAPIHLQPAHAGRVKTPRGAAVAERLTGEILSLPVYPQITAGQQDRVAELLRDATARSRR